MAATMSKRGELAVHTLYSGSFDCEECGYALVAGDSFFHDPRTDVHTCSVICAEAMRARGDLRPAPFHV